MVPAFTDTNVLGEVDPDVFVGSRIARRIRVSLGGRGFSQETPPLARHAALRV